MTRHAPRPIERHCDVLVVGGSAAGLAAALQLVRQRRSVIIVDAGEPRNAPAAHMHGFLGRDGTAPSDLTGAGRAEVRNYGGEVLDGRVLTVAREEDGSFRAHLVGGHAVSARRLLIATGLVDELPEVDGVAQHWGDGVIHCPFCHGYEARDRRVVQIVTHPMGLHPTRLMRQLTHDLTVVVAAECAADPADIEVLRAGGVTVVHGDLHRLVLNEDGGIRAVDLTDGARIDADVVMIGPRFRARLEPFEQIGVASAPHPSGLGDHVVTTPTGLTDVQGVYAAGNVTDPSHQVLHAAADGSWVGAMIAFDLAHDDLAAASRTTAAEADWDQRYSGEQVWSGNPNGALVAEVSGLAPGRVLDVGAGEGGDAIWLAAAGWSVTANDISGRALERIGLEARRRGFDVELLHRDANAPEAFGRAGFDLVTAHYASIPRTPDGRGVGNLVNAVAPGGVLLVVSHDLAPLRHPVDTTVASRPFDPDAYMRVDDVAAALADDPEWVVETHEIRPRPAGAASASHHVDDIVLRARRVGV
jgi:thioredoxin reductase/SAM-dependent methyltransferase